MRLATRAQGEPDGELLVVSADGRRCLSAAPRWPNLLAAITRWDVAEPALRALDARLAAGEGAVLDEKELRAPLPRTWQWLDGSAFPVHGRLMVRARPAVVDRAPAWPGEVLRRRNRAERRSRFQQSPGA